MGGAPKALMEVGGVRVIERVVAALGAVLDDLLIVTNAPDTYRFLGLPLVPDIYPDRGSLGGIYSGLKAAAGEAAFTVACDMPFLHPEAVRLILRHATEVDVVVPRVGDQLETLHAAYAKSCLGPIETRLLAGELKITGFFDAVRVLELSERDFARVCSPHVAFMNINTPADLERARQIARGTG
jgi:molybdopterin-guanine dinucleotide biosynthesis protein A